MVSRKTLACACLLAICGLVRADTTGQTLTGYNYAFASDITGYLDISQDVCDITTAVDAADWTTAASVYASGGNSVRADGTLRMLQAWATSGEPSEPHWGLYTLYFGNDSDWLDTFISSGLAGAAPYTSDAARGQIVKKGIQSNLLTAYMLHEVDSGAERTAAGETDDASGAPHAVDEAAAIYFGTKCPGGSIADVAIKRAKSYGLMTADANGACVAPTNLAVAQAFSELQAAARAGDSDAYANATLALEKQLVTIFTQATMTYANELEEIVAAGSDVAGALPDTSVEMAEGIAFFRTIAPLVAEVSEEDAAAIMDALMNPAEGTADKVTAAFQPTLDAYGITAAEIGTAGATSACTGADAPLTVA